MNAKAKDSVFAVGLILLGAYIIWESRNIIILASKPPFNIKDFSISPGMLPIVLGSLLVVFSIIMLITSLIGPGTSFIGHFREASQAFRKALGEVDVVRALACVEAMAIYTFALLGTIPFWAGAFLFLVFVMVILRSARIWTIVLTSGIVITLIVLLFEGFFRTSLP